MPWMGDGMLGHRHRRWFDQDPWTSAPEGCEWGDPEENDQDPYDAGGGYDWFGPPTEELDCQW